MERNGNEGKISYFLPSPCLGSKEREEKGVTYVEDMLDFLSGFSLNCIVFSFLSTNSKRSDNVSAPTLNSKRSDNVISWS